jgi:succinoglycan biosynthesis transport protein ExoP
MSARKGSICRVTAPVPRTDRSAAAPESGVAERPFIAALQVVWRGRWIVAVCLFVSLLVGYYRMRQVVPIYGAHSKLLLEESLPTIVGDPLNQHQSGGYLYTQCEIIHSTALLTKALTEPGVADASCLKGMSNPVAFLKSAVLAGAESQGDLITVGMDSTNPQDAITIVNGVVNAYIKYLSELHQSRSIDILKILEKQHEEAETELKKQQQQLTDFKQNNLDLALQAGKGTGISIPYSNELQAAQLKTREFTFANAEARNFPDDEKDAESLRSILNAAYTEAGMPTITDPVFDPALTDECRKIENAMEPMAQNNPAYKDLEKQLAIKKREISLQKIESSQIYRAQLDEKLRDAQAREATYAKLYEAGRAKAMDVNSKEAEYDHLQDQLQDTRNELDMLESKIKTINVSGDMGGLTASVLEPAEVDSASSVKSKIMGMAIVVGLMAGLGGSLLLELVDHRFRSVAEISKLLSLPILGSVPHIMPAVSWSGSFNEMRSNWRKYLKKPAGFMENKQWKATQNLMECGQAMHLQPRSDVAEAYRAVRTAIYFGLSGIPAKTILITSPASGDGKTTLASNLAIAIAQAGRRVLLIDADCWRPAQHDIFGLTEDIGLTSVLMKKTSLTEAVRKTDVEHLDVLPCGELPSNPAELLESQALVDLLNEASEQYDQILIDSPPVVPITDARILAASCGATILVLRAGKSTRHQADEAFEALAAVGAPVLGVVVNDVVRPSHTKSYGYYRYVTDRANRFSSFEQNGHSNGNGHTNSNGTSNGNGHTKHLTGSFVDTEEVIDEEPI